MAKPQGDEKRQPASPGEAMAPAAGAGAPRPAELDRPWSVRRLFDEFDRMFEELQQQVLGPQPMRLDTGGGSRPRMEVQDTGREVVLTLELPGFEPDELHVECTDDVLTIRGEHREEDEAGGYRSARSVFRQVVVPSGCDIEKVHASFRNGLLTLRLPRAQENVRRIPISTESAQAPGQRAA